MGWSRGYDVMTTIIESYNANLILADIPDTNVINYWKALIIEFENMDADTLEDCLGKNPLWDKAYIAVQEHRLNQQPIYEMKGKFS